MNNLAYVEVEEPTEQQNPGRPVIAYRREENSAKSANIVQSIVDRQLANGSMAA